MRLNVRFCDIHLQWCVTNQTGFCLFSSDAIVPALRFRREALRGVQS